MNDQVILSVTKRGGGLEVTTNRNVPPDAATGVILLSVQRGIQTAAGKSGHMNMEEIGLDRSGK